MKRILSALVLITLVHASGSFAQMESASGSGNGGGLVERNGQYLSFLTAGAKTKVPVSPLTVKELPDLEVFERKINQLLLPDSIRYEILGGTRISHDRKYYKANLRNIPAADLERIKNEYKKSVSINGNDTLVLAAITQGKETYLFEPYFEIVKENSRLAILAHEAFWVLSLGKANYQKIIQAEMQLESCFDQIQSNKLVSCMNFAYAYADLSNRRYIPIQVAAYDDWKMGRLNALLNSEGSLPFTAIFPFIKNPNFDLSTSIGQGELYDHLRAQSQTNPESKLFQELLMNYQKIWFRIIYTQAIKEASIELWKKPEDERKSQNGRTLSIWRNYSYAFIAEE